MLKRSRTSARQLRCETLEDRRLLVAGFLPGDDAIGLSTGTQRFVAVEEGPGGYLAAWTDDRATDSLAGAQDIYGQLLDTSGAPTGPPVLIANVGRQQQRPDIAWNEGAQEWMVVFEGQDPDWFYEDNVYGVRVAANGDVVDDEPILIFRETGNQGAYEPQVASNGDDWVVVTDQWYGEPVSQRTIFGKRISGDGAIIDTNPKILAQADLIFPDIEYAGGTYMLAANNVNNQNVYVRRIDTDLNPVGSVRFVASGTYQGPSIASNGSEFLVVGETTARRINTFGQNVGASIPIGNATVYGSYKDSTWNGSEWVVGLLDAGDGTFAQRIAADGQLIDASPILLDSNILQEQIAVAGIGGETVTLFSHRPGFDQDVQSVRLTSDGTVMSPSDVTIGMARQRALDVVDGPNGENLVVYTSEVGAETRIVSQRIHDDGTVIDQEPLVVHVLPSGYSAPKVAWNGSVYMVGWSNQVVRLNADNTLLDTTPITVPEPIGAIAAAGDNFVVGMYSYQSFNEPLQYMEFVRVRGSDAMILDATPRLVAGGFVREMTAANFGSQAIFAWQQHARHDNASSYVQGFVVNENAQWNGTFDAGGGKAPDIAADNGEALVVWGGGDIEGQFIDSSGALSGFNVTIATQPLPGAAPDVAWVGDEYVVAWQDYRHQEEIMEWRSDIYTARVLADGTVRDPSGMQISATGLHERAPAVVGGSSDHWVLYPQLHGMSGVAETYRIAYEYNPELVYPMQPFERIGDRGTLAGASEATFGMIAFPAETHDYSFFVEAVESVTAHIQPADPSAVVSAEFVGMGGMVTAAGPGDALVVPLQTAAVDGEVTLNLTSDSRTAYELAIYRNANAKALIDGSTVNLQDSALSLGDSIRFAAVGMADGQVGGTGFEHTNDPGAFIDISSTGTQLAMNLGPRNDRTWLTTTVGNDVFPAGLTTIAPDGVIVQGINTTYLGGNEPLPDSFYLGSGAALAPYWALLGYSGGHNGDVFLEERVVNGVNTLIVQWQDESNYFHGGAATFQIQVFETGPVKVRYAYPDITFGHPDADGGADASIGLQLNGTTGYQFSYRTTSLADGDVLDFLDRATVEDVDEFTLDLVGGAPVDIALTGKDASLAAARLELLDPTGAPVASGSTLLAGNAVNNLDQGIFAYTPTQSGAYTVRVGTELSTQYALEATQALTLDVESDGLRSLDATQAAMGLIEQDPALTDYTHFNDPTAFVDISATGNPLYFTTDDGLTSIDTSISNPVIPAGELLVGNDGVVVLDHVQQALSGNAHQQLPAHWLIDTGIFPLWMDFEEASGSVFYEERFVDGIQTMIVQWNDVQRVWGGDGGTFQLQLFDQTSGFGTFARFAYADIDFGDPAHNNGANATIGVQLNQQQTAQFSYNAAAVSDGDVIDFGASREDRYEIQLAAGETVTLETQTPFDHPQRPLTNALDPGLALFDPNGDLLVVDQNSASDGRNARISVTATTGGAYAVAVFGESGTGEYLLQVNPPTVVDPDFDDDGDYDIDDLDALTTAIVNAGPMTEYDLSGDGALDMGDVDMWRELAGEVNLGNGLSYLPADANLDGNVDGSDFIVWNANKFSASSKWSEGDFNVDGTVDGRDFLIWNQHKFSSSDRKPAGAFSSEKRAADDDHAPTYVELIFAELGAEEPTLYY